MSVPQWGVSKIRIAWDGLTSLPRWATSKVRRKRPSLYRAKLVEEFPDTPSALTVYLAGESPHIWGRRWSARAGAATRSS